MLGLILLFAPATARALERVVLQLQWYHQFQFAGYYAALWQGYYREAGFDVEIRGAFPDGGGALRSPVNEVVERRADFGTSNAGILLARAAGAPVTVVASIFQQSGTRLYFRRGLQPVRTPADLVGLRLGRNQGNELLDVELRAMLAAEGIDPARIPVVPYPPNRLLQAMSEGAFDMIFGYALSAPWEQRELGVQFGEMRPADYGIAFYGDSLFTRADLARSDPEKVSRFREASLRGWRYALENGEEMARRITEQLPRTLTLQDRLGYNLFQVPIVRELTLYPVVELGNVNPDRWRRMVSQLVRAGVVPEGTALSIDDFFFDPERDRAQRQRQQQVLLLWSLAGSVAVALVVVGWSLSLRRAVRTARHELERSQAALLQAQKLEALGRMTGGVAHDFNNLLQVVLSGLSLLERAGPDEARRRAIRASMRQAVDRGSRIVRQLLVFARREAFLPERIDPAARIGGMRGLLEQSLRGDIELRMDLPPGLWPVEVDATQLEVALLNLAVNGRDAMPGGGTLTVTAENVTMAELPGVPHRLMGDFLRLSVSDTGTGMPPEVVARAFEPFFTTKDVGKGTGLGLPQVHGFAHHSGGTVRIASRPGAGTTVSIYLPRTMGGAAPPAPEVDVAPVGGRSLSVLLVEDDRHVANLLTGVLQGLGHQVEHVPGAAGALETLGGTSRPDVVLSDVMMPGGMSGLDLAREVRARRPDVPVVLATGYSEGLETVLAAGLPVLRKPFGPEELQAVLQQVTAPRAVSESAAE
ncbi:MAG TPA: ABC transporter substrate-binding protein [Acetobacteraceae bacterium]|nr:ABC transporter substrate-binding protein [Acetobacteraceae bacterium]